MALLVRLARGDWRKDDTGCWVFWEDPGWMSESVELREKVTLHEIVDEVKKKYKLGPGDEVDLSYQWPSWMMGPAAVKALPIFIVDDEDVSLFMAIRVDLEEMYLRVKVRNCSHDRTVNSYSSRSMDRSRCGDLGGLKGNIFSSGINNNVVDRNRSGCVSFGLPRVQDKSIEVIDKMYSSNMHFEIGGPSVVRNEKVKEIYTNQKGLSPRSSLRPIINEVESPYRPRPHACGNTEDVDMYGNSRGIPEDVYNLWKQYGICPNGGGSSGSKHSGEEIGINPLIRRLDLNTSSGSFDVLAGDATDERNALNREPETLQLTLGSSTTQPPNKDRVDVEGSFGLRRYLLGGINEKSPRVGTHVMFSEDNMMDTSGDDGSSSSGGSRSSEEVGGYSTVMPLMKERDKRKGKAIMREKQLPIERNVRRAGPLTIRDVADRSVGETIVPTNLFDRDAAPYVDDPGVEDELQRAIGDVDYEGDDIFVGRLFKNKEDCQIKMAIHAIHRRFHFQHAQSRPNMLILVCVGIRCPWRVYAVKVENSDRFEIRSCTLNHTCSVDSRGNFHRQASTAVIGDLMRSKYVGGCRGPRPNELRRMLRTEFSLNVSYWKAWRAREIAMDNAMGSAQGSFALVPPYFDKLLDTNPDSVVDMETKTDPYGVVRFRFAFMSLAASIKGYQYLRKVIVIDGTHLRGKYGGCLIAASGQDANYQIFPLAFGIVDSENDASWVWFMRKLQIIIPDSYDLVFVSDRHSSIYVSIKEVYPMASHAACIVHLQRNIRSIFKNEKLCYLVGQAARAYRLSEFNRIFTEIAEMNRDCAGYLTNIGYENWTRTHFVGERFNVMTSNIAEALNNVLTMARDFPIISIFESLRTTLVSWFALRREAARMEDDELTPKVQQMVIENFEKSTGYVVLKIGEGYYEVRDHKDSAFVVHLWEKTCSCREFQLLKIPCTHTVAAAIQEGIRVDTLVNIAHTVTFWRLTYAGLIMHVPDMATLTPSPGDVGGGKLKPPSVRRRPGRPRKRRFFSRGEFKISSRRRCTRCKNLGHNRATCTVPLSVSCLSWKKIRKCNHKTYTIIKTS